MSVFAQGETYFFYYYFSGNRKFGARTVAKRAKRRRYGTGAAWASINYAAALGRGLYRPSQE
jgi:hypothetical protein